MIRRSGKEQTTVRLGLTLTSPVISTTSGCAEFFEPYDIILLDFDEGAPLTS